MELDALDRCNKHIKRMQINLYKRKQINQGVSWQKVYKRGVAGKQDTDQARHLNNGDMVECILGQEKEGNLNHDRHISEKIVRMIVENRLYNTLYQTKQWCFL